MPAIENLTSSEFEVKPKKAKVLFFDIETSSLVIESWGTYQTDALRVVKTWTMLAWSAKWQGGKHVTKCLADYEGYQPGTQDDKALVGVVNEPPKPCGIRGCAKRMPGMC